MITKVQEVFRTPNTHDHKKTSAHHITLKMPRSENKERILKAKREKYQLSYKGKHIRITSDFSLNTLKARKA
jgi:hypothetical protein